MTLPQKTLLGAILGIVAGIIFGKYCAYLRPIGSLYVLLLQVAVYPYLISSLLRSLGSLVPQVGLQLLKRGWMLYVLLLAVTFLVMALLSSAIPTSASSITMGTKTQLPIVSTLLALLIPSNPFAALSQNYVPAIIIFCVFYGMMMQSITKKAALFEILDTLTQASLNFWNRLVPIVPYAVFALFADSAGTINLLELKELSVYLVVFFLGTLLLAFWIIPALITSLTTLTRKEIFAGLREGLILSISTTLSVVALPAIQAFTRTLIATNKKENEEDEPEEIVRTVSSVAYAFAQLGNCFLYVFIIFAAFYLSRPLDAAQQILLPFMSYLSSIGSPSATVNSISFLGAWLNLPDSTTNLYVSTITLTRYGQVIASVMGISALTILMTLAYYKKLKIQVKKLLFHFIVILLILSCFAITARKIQPMIFSNLSGNLNTFQLDSTLTTGIRIEMISKHSAQTNHASQDSLARILQTHVLRVGYNPNVAPFCYFNNRHELVGYDVAMIYALAHSLNVLKIEFIPFNWNNLMNNVDDDQYDIAIGGLYATPGRLVKLGLSDPYFNSSLALIVLEKEKNNYLTMGQTPLQQKLVVGIFDDPVLKSLVQRYFSDAKIMVMPDYTNLANQMATHQLNAALWTQEQAESWIMLHPGYAAIIPQRFTWDSSLAFAYLTAKNSPQFLGYLNYWLKLRKMDGFQKQQYQRWLLAKPTVTQHTRWNIIDNVIFPML